MPTESPTIWAEYKDGFEICLRFIDRDELRKKVKRATVSSWDPKTHQKEEKVDEKKYAAELADVILDWRGLSPRVLRSLVVSESRPTENTPYSPQRAEELMRKAYHFDAWVQSTVTELELFNAYEDAELKKKSVLSSSGG